MEGRRKARESIGRRKQRDTKREAARHRLHKRPEMCPLDICQACQTTGPCADMASNFEVVLALNSRTMQDAPFLNADKRIFAPLSQQCPPFGLSS